MIIEEYLSGVWRVFYDGAWIYFKTYREAQKFRDSH